jgi:hypothetical protein
VIGTKNTAKGLTECSHPGDFSLRLRRFGKLDGIPSAARSSCRVEEWYERRTLGGYVSPFDDLVVQFVVLMIWRLTVVDQVTSAFREDGDVVDRPTARKIVVDASFGGSTRRCHLDGFWLVPTRRSRDARSSSSTSPWAPS